MTDPTHVCECANLEDELCDAEAEIEALKQENEALREDRDELQAALASSKVERAAIDTIVENIRRELASYGTITTSRYVTVHCCPDPLFKDVTVYKDGEQIATYKDGKPTAMSSQNPPLWVPQTDEELRIFTAIEEAILGIHKHRVPVDTVYSPKLPVTIYDWLALQGITLVESSAEDARAFGMVIGGKSLTEKINWPIPASDIPVKITDNVNCIRVDAEGRIVYSPEVQALCRAAGEVYTECLLQGCTCPAHSEQLARLSKALDAVSTKDMPTWWK